VSRSRIGWKAQKLGSQFEMFLEHACKFSRVDCVRIPDGCRKVRAGSGIRLLAVKTPFDYILAFKGRVAFLDTKSCGSDRFPYSRVEAHQLEALRKLGRHAIAGYLVYFSESKIICFFSWSRLLDLKPRQSLGISDADLAQGAHTVNIAELFNLSEK